jgi:hypothetical protein
MILCHDTCNPQKNLSNDILNFSMKSDLIPQIVIFEIGSHFDSLTIDLSHVHNYYYIFSFLEFDFTL